MYEYITGLWGGDAVPLHWIVWAPLFGFLANIFFGRFMPKAIAGGLACVSIAVSLVFAIQAFLAVKETGHGVTDYLFAWESWIKVPGVGKVGEVNVDFGLVADQLSSIMLLVVTGVGFLIHLYSTAYMEDDKRFHRYMSYLNLFSAFMLLLVLSKNLLGMFVGWEGVGLCSYLLIGFWFDDKKKGIDNSKAGMKAFIVNRVGDFGFTIGVLLLFTYLGSAFGVWTLDFETIKATVGKHSEALNGGIIFAVCCLLFVGATGKSAQIPLYVWLPDAMAGPTPVSALIHAATMVTAGVYMCSRMGFLFLESPQAMTVVAVIGGLTAVMAALIGFAQNDIKKVLAYSTVSQLGFMFMAVGAGAFWVAIFHVMTHAFFKACLFLGSGSVIMGCHHEQDIRKMGGLKNYMFWTWLTFIISSAALAGLPPLSGFFSKDEILWQVFNAHHMPSGVNYLVYACGVVGAFCTAFYMTRLCLKTFWGEYRGTANAHSGGGVGHDDPHHGGGGHHADAPHEEEHHAPSGPPHESPARMVIPLCILAVLAIGGGLLGTPHAINQLIDPQHKESWMETWLNKAILPHHDSKKGHEEHHGSAGLEFGLMGLSVAIALVGIGMGIKFHKPGSHLADDWVEKNRSFYETVKNKFYVDEIYEATVIRATLAMNQVCARFDNSVIDGAVNASADITDKTSHYTGLFDNEVVDGAVNGVADGIMIAGQKTRSLQSGNIKTYLTFALLAALGLIALFSIWFHWDRIEELFETLRQR